MPTYTYTCKCKKTFDVKRGMTDESPAECPACHSQETRRIITGAPHIAIAWRNTLGLGHSGQIALRAVANNRLLRKDKRAVKKKLEIHNRRMKA